MDHECEVYGKKKMSVNLDVKDTYQGNLLMAKIENYSGIHKVKVSIAKGSLKIIPKNKQRWINVKEI